MLTKADVKKYQKLYKARFGVDIDRDDAYTELSLLVRQFQIIYQPITQADLDELEARDKEIKGDKDYDKEKFKLSSRK
jgi:hypothetical protein